MHICKLCYKSALFFQLRLNVMLVNFRALHTNSITPIAFLIITDVTNNRIVTTNRMNKVVVSGFLVFSSKHTLGCKGVISVSLHRSRQVLLFEYIFAQVSSQIYFCTDTYSVSVLQYFVPKYQANFFFDTDTFTVSVPRYFFLYFHLMTNFHFHKLWFRVI